VGTESAYRAWSEHKAGNLQIEIGGRGCRAGPDSAVCLLRYLCTARSWTQPERNQTDSAVQIEGSSRTYEDGRDLGAHSTTDHPPAIVMRRTGHGRSQC
jgi:hypothetical protein